MSRSTAKGKQPLSVTFPEVAKQWHPENNGDLTPDEVFSGAHKKVWWKCPEGEDHEWQARLSHRTHSGSGCPFCSGLKASITNSLATLFPEIAKELHPENNGELTPSDIVAGSGKKVWWKCPEGADHEWQATPSTRTTRGLSCPFCAGKKVSITNSLETLCPEIAKEWHPENNGELTPSDVVAGSGKKIWWKCPEGEDHEWEAAVSGRTGPRKNGCPFCRGLKVSETNSLANQFPDIAAQWHPTKNQVLKPSDVVAGSHTDIWWQCSEGDDHEWEAKPSARTGSKKTGCPFCRGLKVSETNSLANQFPDIAAQWHPTKNQGLKPSDVVAGSEKGIWWKCPVADDHEWESTPYNRTQLGTGCPCCAGRQVSITNSLVRQFPDIAAQFHPTKNKDLHVEDLVAGSHIDVWWQCPIADDHEWLAPVFNRTRHGSGCPSCWGRQASETNSLASLFPDIAAQWHPTQNGDLTPENVPAGSTKKAWWKCPVADDHEWEASPGNRTGSRKTGCRCCAGHKLSVTNSLATLFPEIAAQWHPTKNGKLTSADMTAGSNTKAWWQCPEGADHEWLAAVKDRTHGRGCPVCNSGWTIDNIRLFVQSLIDHDLFETLLPAELFLLAQQNGLITANRSRSEFVKALTAGQLSKDSLNEFVKKDNESELKSLFDDVTAEELIESKSQEDEDEKLDLEIADEHIPVASKQPLPRVSASDVLDSVESDLWSTADEDAVDYLIASGVAKLWEQAYRPEQLEDVKSETQTPRTHEYSERVRDSFRSELDAAESLAIPDHYAFEIKGNRILPNLMQRHAAVRVMRQRRVGNWSGTGSGKTLSAILASRMIESELSVIVCPNSVVTNWVDTISNAFPDSRIVTKTLAPKWPAGKGPRYLVINYEKLQQPSSEADLAHFLSAHRVDMVVIDEIHYAKQRTYEASKRRRLVEALCATATEANEQLAVLGMSATPVINNLREGLSMINLVTGIEHSDLEVRVSLNNCMKIHQRLVSIGIRWMPDYPKFAEQNPTVDVSHLVDEIQSLPKGNSGVLELEQVLIEAKLDCILDHVEDGTLIYTEYVEGIVPMLTRALHDAGWKVGRYTGQDKTGFAPFCSGKLNVLIGSSCVGTGVDGLQHRAAKLIIACAPWTAAAYDQLVGRLVRQGQQKPVEVVFPISIANLGSEEWSWCQTRLNRIQYKKSVADAAVDGVVPTGHLRTPTQALQDAIGWLRRLNEGEIKEIRRPRIVVPLSDEPVEVEQRTAKYGDFSVMNHRWNATGSAKLHDHLKQDKQEWENYHTLYRQARSDWPVVPLERIGDWISQIPKNRIVGDFGCGEDLLGDRLRKDGYTVHSYDHVAISDQVIVCDVAQGVPLDDNEIDVAVFSLSLMGANTGDYLREAARTLVFDGRLIVCEATSRFPEDDAIRERLELLGFHVTDITQEGQFTFIEALRTDRDPDSEASLL